MMSDTFLSERVLKKKLAYVFSAWGVMPPIRKSINEAIEKSVTADVVPVVRCKDCERWGTRKADGYGFCCIWGTSVKEDAFCSSGVKNKMDGGDGNV